MKHEELILRGRALANGDGVMIDLERAYMLWAPIKDELTDEDLALFSELEACFGDGLALASNAFSTALSRGATPIDPAVTMYAALPPKSPAEVRDLFEKLMQTADEATLARLYRSLARMLDDQGLGSQKLRKTEHIRFGNNLGFLMHQYYWNRSAFLEKINARLAPMGLSMSSAALSQIINGVHGMNPAAQLLLVEMIQEADALNKQRNAQIEKDNRYRREGQKLPYRPALTREMTSADLHLPLSELIGLYRDPRIDERIRSLATAL